jgi:hypothetical protein
MSASPSAKMSLSTKLALKISSLIPDRTISSPLFHPNQDFSPPSRTCLKTIPDRPDKPLDFWYIKSHDRKALSEIIMPYMAAHLPRRYLLQSLLERNDWACEMVGVQTTEMEGFSFTRLQNTTAAFWKNPRHTTVKLVELTRIWFFTLLRYAYRSSFSRGSKTSPSSPHVQDISAWETHQYTSELTESHVYRLTRVPNKYGAKFYRSCYRRTKQCAAWKEFCTRIQTFCDSVGLFASPKDPEQSLQELQNNLTSVCNTTAQLERTSILAHGTARYVKEVDGRIASEILSRRGLMKEIRQHIASLQLECEKLQSAQTLSVNSQQRNSKLLVELQRQCRATEGELQCLDSRIVDSEVRVQRNIATLAQQIEERRTATTYPGLSTDACPNVEVLVACRWLLEHLPPGPPARQGFGNRWRLYWQSQWKEYKNGKSGHSHPLRSLVGDERYYKAGSGLYGTLSSFLHEYGRLRVDPLDSIVQKVLDTIGPVHYKRDGQIDLNLERARWVG